MTTNDLLDLIGDGVVVFGTAMNYTYINQKGGQLLGRTPTDLVGKNYWVEYPGTKGTPFANACIRALETQQQITIDECYPVMDRWQPDILVLDMIMPGPWVLALQDDRSGSRQLPK